MPPLRDRAASVDLISQATDVLLLHRVPTSNALIVQAAHWSGCVKLLTEDRVSGNTLAGVRLAT